jgi:integrase
MLRRLSEILELRWPWVNLERKRLELPDSKTGAKFVFLNEPAIEVLSGLPRLDANPFVVAGSKAGQHLVNLQKPWRRIRKVANLRTSASMTCATTTPALPPGSARVYR